MFSPEFSQHWTADQDSGEAMAPARPDDEALSPSQQ